MSILDDILSRLGLKPAEPVDIARMLDNKAILKNQPLNWRESVVDLMKVLDINSSHTHRCDLARELGYGGPMTGTDAAQRQMNTWLHREIMSKVSENGGKVPEELR